MSALYILLVSLFVEQWQTNGSATVIPSETPSSICRTRRCDEVAKELKLSINLSVDPCDNFYDYVCGRWTNAVEIPESRVYVAKWNEDTVLGESELAELLTSDVSISSSAIQKAKTVYKYCVNQTARDQTGSKPLIDALSGIGSWPIVNGSTWKEEDFDLTMLLASVDREFAEKPLVDVYVWKDSRNATRFLTHMEDCTLPIDTDYYTDESQVENMNAYKEFMADAMSLLLKDMAIEKNTTELEGQVAKIVEFEKSLALILLSSAEKTNPMRSLNFKKLGSLMELVPEIDWIRFLKLYFPQENITEDFEIVVWSPEYFAGLSTLLSRVDRETVANYIFWRLLYSAVEFLDTRFLELSQKLMKVHHGRKATEDKPVECLPMAKKALPLAVGAVYVRRFFTREDKAAVQIMVENLRKAYTKIIDKTIWLNEEEKTLAHQKLEATVYHIGYPELVENEQELDKFYEDLNLTGLNSYYDIYRKTRLYAVSKEKLWLKSKRDRREHGKTAHSPAEPDAFCRNPENALAFSNYGWDPAASVLRIRLTQSRKLRINRDSDWPRNFPLVGQTGYDV